MNRITIHVVYLFCGSIDAGEEKVLFTISNTELGLPEQTKTDFKPM